MTTFFVLHHKRPTWPGRTNDKYIGVFKTRAEAEATAETLREKPGFIDDPDCFEITERKLGETSWRDGFTP